MRNFLLALVSIIAGTGAQPFVSDRTTGAALLLVAMVIAALLVITSDPVRRRTRRVRLVVLPPEGQTQPAIHLRQATPDHFIAVVSKDEVDNFMQTRLSGAGGGGGGGGLHGGAGGGGGGGAGAPGGAGGSVSASPPAAAPPPLRVRLAAPPDQSIESDLDWPHLAVTNDTDDHLTVTVMGYWGQSQVSFEWDPWGTGTTLVIPPRAKGTLAFVARLRSGGKPFTFNRLQFVPGVCYVCDPVFQRSGTAGPTLPIGTTQIRIDVHASGYSTVSRRFDVVVPSDKRKPLWVVPRGESGSE